EVSKFSNAMPRHWQYLAEKDSAVQKILDYDPKKGNLEQAELVVIGAAVSLRESMRLLAGQAGEGGAPDVEKPWPELAQFDCYACHHDLRPRSWRQQRGYAGRPGRPDMRPWTLALVPLAVHHAAGSDAKAAATLSAEFQAKRKAVVAAFNARPF